MRAKASSDGKALLIMEIKEEHNLEIFKAIYDHRPCNRKLKGADREKTAELLQMSDNKNQVQQ